MLKNIKINLKVIEAMNYFWLAARDKENISEQFFNDIGNMEELKIIYDDEFDQESVRRTLSAIRNREPFNGNKKERKLWNNNMWMMEDLDYTELMITPIKVLNLDDSVEGLKDNISYEEVEVVFTMLNMEEYLIKDNKLLINFFRIKPSLMDDSVTIGDTDLKEYVISKIREI